MLGFSPFSWLILLVVGIIAIQYQKQQSSSNSGYMPPRRSTYLNIPTYQGRSTHDRKPQASKPTTNSWCIECGSKVDDDVNFCRFCGTDLRI